MSTPDDTILQQRAAAGEDAAFEALYVRFAEPVRTVAWRLCRRQPLSDDLANEAWCRAYRLRASFDPSRAFFSWVCGILQNVWREHARSTAGDAAGDIGASNPHMAALIPDPEDFDEAVSQAEMLTALNDCVTRLSDDDQKLIRWRFFDGESLRAVAQRLGIAEATVRGNRLPAAMKQLESCLKKKGVSAEIFGFSAAQDGPRLQYPVEE
jgi:RNA polymerase sigma-70 factor (ECF subfamily)